jgi:hypothetical protein
MPAERDTSGPASAEPAKEQGSGISQFLGKVLNQLSVSSWLPAAMLVANVAVLVQLHSDRNLSITLALRKLTEKPLGVLIVLLFALLIATMITQAFEYEIIRVLEGYIDFTRGPLHWLVSVRIQRHAIKLEKLARRREAAEFEAFAQARVVMISSGSNQADLDVIERDMHGLPRIVSRRRAAKALSIPWYDHLPASTRYRLDALDARLAHYPEPSRLLPTRLGNTLRAAEDELPLDPDEDLVGYVVRNYDRLPEAVREEHQDYRTRLDMYCSLFLVFVFLSVAAIVLLRAFAGPLTVAASALTYLMLAWVSYEAAVASARGYGDVLKEVNRFAEPGPADETRRSSTSPIRKFLHLDAVARTPWRK